MTTKPKKTLTLRQSLETAFQHAEGERQQKLHLRRIELARSGMIAYKNKKVQEAVRAFQAYLSALEEVKNVPEGLLTPSLFSGSSDSNDLVELMTLTGIYWELVTLYDRTSSAERYRDFSHYMEKFLLFSKGMPFQTLCAETLRKYIRHGKPVHVTEFKTAYQALGGKECFIASSLVDLVADSTIEDLQRLRDERLVHHAWGRFFISCYKKFSPGLARWLNTQPQWVRSSCALTMDALARLLT